MRGLSRRVERREAPPLASLYSPREAPPLASTRLDIGGEERSLQGLELRLHRGLVSC
jgi:hypothetical protein